MENSLLVLGARAVEASGILRTASTAQKNAALAAISEALMENTELIISENKKDLENARAAGMRESLIDRLALSRERIKAVSDSVKKVIALEDPVGEIIQGWIRPNGLRITKQRTPLGVIGIIYEARPNVTVDAAVLCLKTGNATILRGGKEAINSNICLVNIMRQAIERANLPKDSVTLVTDTSRQSANDMMKLNGILDLLIPRGGAGLIRTVIENATVPVIETGAGNCHIYVDRTADLRMAADIVFNAKTSRPSVCNAMETLLVHSEVAGEFLPMAKKLLDSKNVEIRGCSRTMGILGNGVTKATEEDYFTEYNDYILAVKVVDSLDSAISHINKYSTKHSEAIITNDYSSFEKFTARVDSAAVYLNASTRFTDGEEFGFGAEIGISTQKLHARGPMGLRELTSVKYIIQGNGQIR